ncbi:hypothetical protein V7O66_03540 [Methanolobus sp. ZRKC3]|uniref:hypothetical protein n=1 Tax=Methanolobus sp. ZRKC3 TaxID=3125786 RepID=UPI00325622BF
MKESNIVESLKSNSTESLLYIATMEPKIQAKAIELIYNKKNINSSPIQNARDRLADRKIIVYGEGVSKVPIKANIQPFLDYLLEKSKEQSNMRISKNLHENTLNEIDIKYLKLIMDSNFYRNIFFNSFFFDNGGAIIQNTLKRDINKLTLPVGAFGYMEAMLTSIINMSFWLEKSGEFTQYYIKDKEIEKIVEKYSNPNNFVDSFLDKIHSEIFEHTMDYAPLRITMEWCGLDYNPQPYSTGLYPERNGYEYYLDKTIFSGMFLLFPPRLIEKLQLSELLTTACTFTMHFPVEVVDYLKYGN